MSTLREKGKVFESKLEPKRGALNVLIRNISTGDFLAPCADPDSCDRVPPEKLEALRSASGERARGRWWVKDPFFEDSSIPVRKNASMASTQRSGRSGPSPSAPFLSNSRAASWCVVLAR
jgi:hypothetical protein